MEKNKTVSFDGGGQVCYVCEVLQDRPLQKIHPAAPGTCEKCSKLTPLDLIAIKDKAQQRRAITMTGAPIVLAFLKAKVPELFGGRRRPRKRR